jgi:cytoskeleton protein RodZ
VSEDDVLGGATGPDVTPAAGAEPGAEASVGTEAPSSFGARLASAREAAGMSVGDVAGQLRLHPGQVRALESGDLRKLPEAVYVRGFVRSYARLVGLDPGPLIDDLNAGLAPPPGSVVEGMARAQDYSPVKAASREQVSRQVVLGLAILALVGLGAIGWYATREPPPQPPEASMVPAAPVATPPVASVPAQAPEPAAAQPATDGAPATEAAPATPVEAPPGKPALLSISFSGVSWVEVTDAQGSVVVSQLARSGEVLQPAGVPPFDVVIGDASKAAVAVRGEALSLDPVTRGNVARFTVK